MSGPRAFLEPLPRETVTHLRTPRGCLVTTVTDRVTGDVNITLYVPPEPIRLALSREAIDHGGRNWP